jgi:hypothetical protein
MNGLDPCRFRAGSGQATSLAPYKVNRESGKQGEMK